jgi:iron complex outermembrane receptor protein
MTTSTGFNRQIAAAIAAALVAPLAGTAYAQQGDADAFGLEEIVVTARKVEENLMTVPMAITAFSSKDIESAGMKNLNDVMRMTPSFNFVNQFGGSGRNDRSTNSLVFRGLYISGNAGLSAGGLLFIDGAPVIGAQPPPVADVERIEVLKGPQSAYFGRSAFAGAINFVTRDPSKEFSGKVSAEFSSWKSHDASLSVEGGLGDNAAARLTLRSFDRGGQYRNAADPEGKRLGGQTTQSASLTAVWEPTESLKIKTYINAFKDNDGPPAQLALKSESFTGRVDSNGNCVPFSQAPAGTAALGQAANSRASFGYVCGTVPTISDISPTLISGDWDTSPAATNRALFSPPNPAWKIFDPSFNTSGGLNREAFQGDVRIDYEFGGGYTLSSLTAAHRDKTMTLIDLNYRSARNIRNNFNSVPTFAPNTVSWAQFLLISQVELKDWSQELRLTSPQEQALRWTVGVNWFDGHTPGGTVYGMSPIGPLFAAAITEQNVETPAAFGGLYWDVTDKLTISAEGRYQKDKLNQIPKVGTTGAVVTGAAAAPLNASFSSFAPRVSIDYQLTDDTLLYALFSRGYRPGGFNSGLVTSSAATIAALQAAVPTAGLTFAEEQLDNYEIGIKSTFLDGRARAVLTYFDSTWKDGQVSNSVPVVVAGTANLIPIVINNGEADLKGIEFEGQLQVTRNLKLSGTFAYNDTEIVNYGLGAGACIDCNFVWGNFSGAVGNQLPTVPKTTWSLSAELGDKFANGLDWFSRLDIMNQGAKFTDFSNVAEVGSKRTLNARVGIRSEAWSVELFGNNLTDDDVVEAALIGVDAITFLAAPPNKNELRVSPPLPRSFGIRATYNF